jgi:hypothetical protein
MCYALLRRPSGDVGALNNQPNPHTGAPERISVWIRLRSGHGLASARFLECHHLHRDEFGGMPGIDAECGGNILQMFHGTMGVEEATKGAFDDASGFAWQHWS